MKRKEQKKWLIDLSAPVEPEIFIQMLSVFAEASGTLTPQATPVSVGDIMVLEDPRKKLPDNPMTRGMRAVHQALADMRVLGKQGYLARIGSLSQIFAQVEIFEDFMDPPDPETGHRMVAESLVRAAATARFKLGLKYIGFDIGDVLAKAIEFEGQASDVEELPA